MGEGVMAEEITHAEIFKYWWKFTSKDVDKNGRHKVTVNDIWIKVIGYCPEYKKYFFTTEHFVSFDSFLGREHVLIPPEDL